MAGALPVIFGQLQWALFELPYRAAKTFPGSRIAPSPSIAAQLAHQPADLPLACSTSSYG
jgi:hypothetical protein